tara:strand:+ start:1694 stop:1918 length:225 start_codon:yes stop_codon:yes gene_type:complete
VTNRSAGEYLNITPELLSDMEAEEVRAQAQGLVYGKKPFVVNAGDGSKVYVRANGENGNGHINGNGTAEAFFRS